MKEITQEGLEMLKKARDAKYAMRRIFKDAIEGKAIGLLPNARGIMCVPPFLLRANVIVYRTQSVKCYALLSELLCSVSTLVSGVATLPASANYIDETLRFTFEESDEASWRMQELIRIHYGKKDCPKMISMLVEVLDNCWPVSQEEDDPASKKVREDLFCLVGEMREVIVTFGTTLNNSGI